jgi:hypothetical protein
VAAETDEEKAEREARESAQAEAESKFEALFHKSMDSWQKKNSPKNRTVAPERSLFQQLFGIY